MRLLVISFVFITLSVGAQDIPLEFEEPQLQQRYQVLIEELRCLVCQNQNLADSHAPLAQDLREEIFGMINAGQSDEEIVEFLVARYGDFVRYRPPLTGYTLLLWFGPFLILGIALVAVYRQAKTRKPDDISINAGQRAELDELMKQKGPDHPV